MAKLFLFFCIAFFAVILVATQETQKPALCSPMHGYCIESSQCCRHLVCMSYRSKCVQKGGLIIPGQDKRPISPFSQD